ncbi:hypothetical protein [Shewanella pneumatophori]|uniref:Uncharacterized protein n=1 Tax=Shewanella pneumatophori TaxID=314092 RepID=A0A9X2CHM7_9GAMM|nr:hypothetical protein [Shewanella pneumatophori]MCL1138650.1 hypothetical protein [Shewanella pneumatophori]
MKKNPFAGFKATPILATLTLILAMCLFLDHTIDSDRNTSLNCVSNSYRVGSGFEDSQQLRIENTGRGVNVSMSYYSGSKLTNKITAVGTVEKIKAPILTYSINLSGGQHSKGLLQAEPNESLQEAIQLAQYLVADNDSEPFLVKVLEMNKTAGMVTIQIDPGNSLWACKIK